MARPLHQFLALLVVTTFVVACTPHADVEPLRTPTLAGSLQAWQSPTPSAMPLPSTHIPTPTPLPTATPHLYSVAAGETMGSIALDFGLNMDDLIVANPEVSPYAMPVGQALVIPDKVALHPVLPALEPLALELSAPACYATLSNGMWCFISVQNNELVVVESVSAEVRLYNAGGKLLVSETAFPLQDRLLAGDAQALLVYFADVPPNSHAQAKLLTAFESTEAAQRYLSMSLQSVLTQIAWDGSVANVSGQVVFVGDAAQVQVVATAYDTAGQIVGVRRWDSVAGEKKFNLTVASLGPAIEYVLLSAEAHR